MIGIICAEIEEIEAIATYMANASKNKIYSFEFISGNVKNSECILVHSGVGKVNAAMCTEALILKYKPDTILNVGVAGGIDNNLSVGDIVVAQNTIQYDFDVSAFSNRKKGQIPGFSDAAIPCTPRIINLLTKHSKEIYGKNSHSGTVLTGDKFINSSNEALKLKNEFGALACDMESGSIAQVCSANKVDFGIVKSISDLANNNSITDFEKFIKKASQNAALLISKFIESYQG